MPCAAVAVPCERDSNIAGNLGHRPGGGLSVRVGHSRFRSASSQSAGRPSPARARSSCASCAPWLGGESGAAPRPRRPNDRGCGRRTRRRAGVSAGLQSDSGGCCVRSPGVAARRPVTCRSALPPSVIAELVDERVRSRERRRMSSAPGFRDTPRRPEAGSEGVVSRSGSPWRPHRGWVGMLSCVPGTITRSRPRRAANSVPGRGSAWSCSLST
jgi:hypothetical protein